MNDKELNHVLEEINKIKNEGTPDDAFTTRQLIERSGYGRDKANDLLRTALDLGLCGYVSDRTVENRCGRKQKIPFYKWITKKSEDERDD